MGGTQGSQSRYFWGGGFYCTVSVAGVPLAQPLKHQGGTEVTGATGRPWVWVCPTGKGLSPRVTGVETRGGPSLSRKPTPAKGWSSPPEHRPQNAENPSPSDPGGSSWAKEWGRRPYGRGVGVSGVSADLGGRRRGPHPEAHPIKEKQRAACVRAPPKRTPLPVRGGAEPWGAGLSGPQLGAPQLGARPAEAQGGVWGKPASVPTQRRSRAASCITTAGLTTGWTFSRTGSPSWEATETTRSCLWVS